MSYKLISFDHNEQKLLPYSLPLSHEHSLSFSLCLSVHVQEGKAAKYSWWDVNLQFKDTTEMKFGSFDYVPSTPIRVVESHRHERYSSSLSICKVLRTHRFGISDFDRLGSNYSVIWNASDTEFRVEFEFQGKKHEVHGELLNLKREK